MFNQSIIFLNFAKCYSNLLTTLIQILPAMKCMAILPRLDGVSGNSILNEKQGQGQERMITERNMANSCFNKNAARTFLELYNAKSFLEMKMCYNIKLQLSVLVCRQTTQLAGCKKTLSVASVSSYYLNV